MKVFLLMVVPLSVFIAATPYTGWDIGHGFVENRDESQTHCTTWPNKANFSEFPNAKMLLDKSCSEHRRDKRVAPGVIAGGIFVLAFIGLWIRIDMVNNKVIDLAQDLASFQNMTAGRLDQLSEQEMKRLMEKMLDEDNLSAALSLFEVDYKLVLHEFGLEKAGVDGLRLLSFEVGCNANSSSYWMQICGTVNPSRKFGIVRKIAPIGRFVNGGMLYRYYNMSHTAVYPLGEVIMADECNTYGGVIQCFRSTNACKLGSLFNCSYTTVQTPDGVFVKEFDLETFVATTEKEYMLHNATGGISSVTVPESGQFLVRLPTNWFIYVGMTNVQGRHNVIWNIEPVQICNDVPPLNHEQVEKMRAGWNATHSRLLSENEWSQMHWNIGFDFSRDSFAHYFFYYKFFIIGTTVLLALFACWWCDVKKKIEHQLRRPIKVSEKDSLDLIV